MAKTTEELLQENNDLLKGLIGKLGSGGGSATVSSGSVPNTQWLSTLGSTASNVVTGLGKMTQGTYNASDGLLNFQQVVGGLGPSAKILGGIGGQVAEATMAVNKSLNTVGQSGVVLGNNLGLYDKAVLGARMSLPEFEQNIKSNSKSIAGLGADMDISALRFLNTAKKIQEVPLAAQLQATGVGSEEFGKILTMVAHNSKMADMSRESVQRSMIASVVSLATEMDNTARLTGISRQEQQESLELQKKKKDTDLLSLTLSVEEMAVMDDNMAKAKKYGQSVQDAVQIYATGGPQNEEETQKVVALGPEMADAARRLSEIKGNTKEDEAKKAAILAEMDQISARKAADKDQIEQMIRLYKSGDSQAKAMAESYLEQSKYGATVTKQNQAAAEAGLTREQYLKRESDRIAQDRKAAAEGKPGSEGEASLAGTTANRMERFAKDTMAGAGTYFNDLNKELGEGIKNFGALNKLLRPYSQEQMAGLPGKALGAVEKAAGLGEVKVPESEKKKEGRADGSLGAVGKLIEDFGAGTEMTLHGKEGVITENQLKSLLGGVGANLKSDLEKAKSMIPTTNTFEKMFGQFKMPTEVPKMPEIPSEITTPDVETSANNEMITGIQDLNKRIERLIAAVEEGHQNSVNAITSKGNMIA